MLLIPERHDASQHQFDPYTESGARSIIRRFAPEVKEMLLHMKENHYKFPEGKTALAASPLASKIWVAAAMKTKGWIDEHESRNGSCMLTLTPKALSELNAITKYL